MKVCIDTVKKYKKEWEYLINGGELVVKCFSELAFPQFKRWLITNKDELDSFTSKFGEVYIINDKYVEFRKALAEGKTIESNFSIMGFGCPDKWVDMSNKFGCKFEHSPKCYRIKAHEPKFKVGDWVTFKDKVLMKDFPKVLEIDNIINEDNIVLKGVVGHNQEDELDKWEPKLGEICIFWDNNHTNEAIITRYSHFHKHHYPMNMPNSCYQNCMPFTGELPPHLKDLA